MSTKGKFLAAIAVFSLLIVAPVQATGVLDGHTSAYNDGNGPASGAWTGSDTYDNNLSGSSHLFGVIEYAVMTNADFLTAFPAADSGPTAHLSYDPSGALVYLYQIFNQGVFDVTAEIVGNLSTPEDIGQFEDTAGEIAASGYLIDNGDRAWWLFGTPILTNEESYILAFSSNFEPTMGFSFTIDGGTSGLSQVPASGTSLIPEPTCLALLGIGLLGFAVRRRR